jgi:hypothetical protein
MSNLSDIGFPVQSEQDVNVLITETIKYVESIKCPHGIYLKFADPSGAEIYLQGNLQQELVGFNPHFDGKSRRIVNLTKAIERDSSELDGGFQALANSQNGDADSIEYPFVFDVPDFRIVPNYQLPQSREIQLTAFASNDFKIFDNEESYSQSQINEPKTSPKSFVASGLLAVQETSENEAPPRPIAIFSGEIKEFELKTNELSGEKFYWFLVDTLGGEIDVVADVKLISSEPRIGGIVSGQFWLSGKINESSLP